MGYPADESVDGTLRLDFDAGKLGKVALTAIERKLIVTANTLLRDGRKWTSVRH